MTESYFKRLRALSLKAFCTTSIALSFIFNLVFFFSQSKRGCISLVHPSYISVFSDGKHESFFLHLMTHKVFSLTSQALAWNVQESSQTGTSCLHTKGFFPLSLTSWLFNCHKTLPLTGFILPGVHHLSFYMSTITLVFLLKEGSFYILMSYIRWRKRSSVCFQNLKCDLFWPSWFHESLAKKQQLQDTICSWTFTSARRIPFFWACFHFWMEKANSIALQEWHCVCFIVHYQAVTKSNDELNSQCFPNNFSQLIFSCIVHYLS